MAGFNIQEKMGCDHNCRRCGRRAKKDCVICHGQITYFEIPERYAGNDSHSLAKCNCNTCDHDKMASVGKRKPLRILIHKTYNDSGKEFYSHSIADHSECYNEFCERITGLVTPPEIKRKDWNNDDERNAVPF